MRSQPNLAGARDYVLQRLARELSPFLVYHSLEHTRDEVVPMVKRLAAMEGVSGEDLLILETAAYYHDIGFVELREGHENISIRIASDVLPGFGYTPEQLTAISGIILATRMPQNPQTLSQEIIADADLDSLGRLDYWERSLLLRDELANFGLAIPMSEWCQRQRIFLTEHQYFTAAARQLRDSQKQRNLAALLEFIS